MDYGCKTCKFFIKSKMNCKLGHVLTYLNINCEDHSDINSIESVMEDLKTYLEFYQNNVNEINSIMNSKTKPTLLKILKFKIKHRDLLWKITNGKIKTSKK